MSKIKGLNKQFTKRDVQRMRNLITGNTGDRVGNSVGYTKEEEDHKEGDIWEEDGRRWTIKNGVKQNITKLDSAKKAHVMPIFCPSCKSKMNPSIDKSYYNIHKKCLNCVVDFEHELRKEGLYEAYEAKIINSDIDGIIQDFTKFIEDQLTESNNSFITEQGDVEKWVGGSNREKIMKGMKETIDYLNSLKK